MITKDLFVKCLNNFQKYDEWEHKLYELGMNFWEQDEVQNLLMSYLDLLKYCCNDYSDDISYFIYEQDYGNKAEDYFITENNGREIKNKTIEDLWNYIVECHPEIEDKELKSNDLQI